MQYRRALIGVIASASLLGTAGVAYASHNGEDNPGFSPCRDTPDAIRAGYYDGADQSDPRHELPTVYAGGQPTPPAGYAGVCGGSGDDAQFIEVGGSSDSGPYASRSDASTSGQPTDQLGALTIGSDYVEVDGAKDNPTTAADPRLDGYVSVGLTENPNDPNDPSDNGPGICASGDNDHAYYDAHPTAKDCNEQLVGIVVGEITG